jgi:hypothetical protein
MVTPGLPIASSPGFEGNIVEFIQQTASLAAGIPDD